MNQWPRWIRDDVAQTLAMRPVSEVLELVAAAKVAVLGRASEEVEIVRLAAKLAKVAERRATPTPA